MKKVGTPLAAFPRASRFLFPIVVSLIFTSNVNATVILNVDGSGQLTGATGVNVDGNLFNVTFQEGSFNSVFSSGFFDPGDLGDANLFSQALLEQVFLDTSLGAFDSEPELTFGCTDTVACITWTPYEISPGDDLGPQVQVSRSRNNESDVTDTFGWGGQPSVTFSTESRVEFNWAVWTPVPEPSTSALMTLGLVGIGFSRRGAK